MSITARRATSVYGLGLPAKLGLLGCLYFSQGLPYGFFTQSLPVILRREGMSLPNIGLTSLLAIPWALKFLWAPAVDRFGHRGFGRRKSWIVPLQGLSLAGLAGFALVCAAGGSAPITALLAFVFLLNLLSATQDIATDGLAVAVLNKHERGCANGLQVAGYRVGMVVGGGVLLILHDYLGMSGIFVVMACLVGLATIPVLRAHEGPPPHEDANPRAEGQFYAFFRRPSVWRVLIIIATYKFGDALAQGMLRPFLVDLGLTLSDLGWVIGTVGFVAGIFGALAGGALVNRLGRRTALLAFGLLQAAAVGAYAMLAFHPPETHVPIYAAIAFEHFAGGMATAALFTCMMDWCGEEESATDYTIQASTVVIVSGIAAAMSGFVVEANGYGGHFFAATILSCSGLGVVFAIFPDGRAFPAEDAPIEERRLCV
ncbi:MAG: MFS transporter [Myxococcota bacterium]